MAYETKVILSLLSQQVGKSKTIKEAYNSVIQAANVEGLELPSYDKFLKSVEE